MAFATRCVSFIFIFQGFVSADDETEDKIGTVEKDLGSSREGSRTGKTFIYLLYIFITYFVLRLSSFLEIHEFHFH